MPITATSEKREAGHSTRSPGAFEIPLVLSAPVRCATPVPVTVGVPLPREVNRDQLGDTLVVSDASGTYPCQISPQKDLSWLTATFLATATKGQSRQPLLLRPCSRGSQVRTCLEVQDGTAGIGIDTKRGSFGIGKQTDRILNFACSHGKNFSFGPEAMQLSFVARSGRRRTFVWDGAEIEEAGPVRATVAMRGRCGVLRAECRLSFFAGTSMLRCELSLHNPRRAMHPGGYWDLGDPGSLLFRELALEIDCRGMAPLEILWQETTPGNEHRTDSSFFELYQESSGGEHWQSLNHVNRHGKVPFNLRGYRIRTATGESTGRRASPVVALRSGDQQLTCTVCDFWQKFPTAITFQQGVLSLKLFPREFPDLHELQAGEKCTRVVWLDFSDDTTQGCQPLAWVHHPPIAVATSAWCASTNQLHCFPASPRQHRHEFHLLLDEALEGENNFLAKREVIDEFGWRNFGDVWADHEQAYAEDPRPVISHYNNQYDLLHSLLMQFLLTADRRWWELADPLARHVLDIDLYHTTRDKPAYNQGMFWHTAHYHAVGRASHRSMSAAMRGKQIPAPGGGPGNEHNYSNGLLLYHQLTGCPRARAAVIQLADWVIAMDDGDRHLLGLLTDEPTGLASCTTNPDYHGPGRGAANSINSLLNAWKLTNTKQYLAKSVELLQRTIHPADDLAALDLENAELRWSYTIYLQSLVRFLVDTAAHDDLRNIRNYAREALLHYARWMCEHEVFYLDHPEKLEYPTETWAAQELRKGTTLLMAARYAAPREATAFHARGMSILNRAWETLLRFESRACTRSLAIVLQQGYLESYLRTTHESVWEDGDCSFGSAASFVSQKQALRAAREHPGKVLSMVSRALSSHRWMNVFRQTRLAESIRRLAE